MIVVYEVDVASKISKPVLCQKCKRGKIGSITGRGKAAVSKRGKPPPEENTGHLQVKCYICGSHWAFTFE